MHRSKLSTTIIFSIIIAFISSPAESIHYISISCKYFKEFRTHIGEISVCFVINNNSILYDDTYISSVSDGNQTFTRDFRTKHFATLDKFYHYMPQGLSNVFDKLKGLEFVHSKLKVIRLKDLKPHIYLEYLNLRGNDIECLDGDIFQYNFYLKFVSFADNKIRRIDTKIFQNLHHIQQFYLNGNYCYSQKANNRYEVETMKEALSFYCAPLYSNSGLPIKCEQLVELEMENSRRLNIKLESEQRRLSEIEEELKMQKKINEKLRIGSGNFLESR